MAVNYQIGDEPVPGSGYRLVDFLGRGGFGEVWKASAPGGAEAALKIIRLGGTEGRKEFRALQLVKRVRHVNLVPIVGFWLKSEDGSVLDDAFTDRESAVGGDTPGASAPLRETMQAPPDQGRSRATELIIAMGLGDKSLFDRLQECCGQGLAGIPLDELLGYMEGAARAIDFLNSPTHDLGHEATVAIQHCDIKPQNIMIVGGATQLCDFGLARMMGADRTTTAAATIAYAAPECLVEGKPSSTTDQYSLAVSYYELRTGALPYSGETLGAVMDEKRNEDFDFSRIPEAEQGVLRRATSYDPGGRYDSALEMVEALCGASAEIVAVPIAPQRPKRYLTRGIALVVAIGLIALLLARPWHREPVGPIPPETPGADHYLQATEHEKEGEYGLAVDDCTEAIAANPDNERAIHLRARCYVNLHKYDEAIEDFQQLDPAEHDVRNLLAEAFFQRADSRVAGGNVDATATAAAAADFSEVIRLQPKHGKAHLGRGRCYLRAKQYDEAIDDLDCARQLMSPQAYGTIVDFAEAYFHRGCGYGDEDLALAIADFEEAMRLDAENSLGYGNRPEYADPYLARGTQALEQINFDAAIEDLNRASEYTPSDARVFSRLGAARFGIEDWKQAEASFTKAIQLDPNDTDYVSRGRTYRELERHEDAIDDFQQAIAINPHNAAAHIALGASHMEQGKTDEAIADLTTAIKVCSEDPDANFSIAKAYVLRASSHMMGGADHFDQADADFSEAIRLSDPRDMAYTHALLGTLARGFAQEGRFPEAIKWAKQAVEFAPDEDAKARYNADLAKYEAGKS